MIAAAVLLALASTVLDVPYVRQEKNGCGSAVLAMVIEYWQHNGVDSHAIQKELYSADASGIYASELKTYLERNGFRAFPFRGEWKDLEEHLAKGRPLIVSLGRSRLHYVVVAGIDSERGLVFLNDPAQRKLMKLDRASFERSWYEHWTLLAVPRGNE